MQQVPSWIWLRHQARLAQSNLAKNPGTIPSDPCVSLWHDSNWTSSSNVQASLYKVGKIIFYVSVCIKSCWSTKKNAHLEGWFKTTENHRLMKNSSSSKQKSQQRVWASPAFSSWSRQSSLCYWCSFPFFRWEFENKRWIVFLALTSISRTSMEPSWVSTV